MATKYDYFPGQQTDERVLYYTRPHHAIKMAYIVGVIAVGVFFVVFFEIFLVSLIPQLLALTVVTLFICLLIIAIAAWWVHKVFEQTEIYITDRRIVKFTPTTPFHKTIRSIFWDQVTKFKTYYKNPLVEKMLGIGSIEVHSKHLDDNINLDYLSYHEDLGNYLDKIFFTFNNKTEDLGSLRQFVPSPRGQRY